MSAQAGKIEIAQPDMPTINDELDELGLVFEHWTRNRDKGITPLILRRVIFYVIRDLEKKTRTMPVEESVCQHEWLPINRTDQQCPKCGTKIVKATQ